MIRLTLYAMMQIRLNQEQLRLVHSEIYGLRKSDSPICVQLAKLDRHIQECGRSKPDTFDTFE